MVSEEEKREGLERQAAFSPFALLHARKDLTRNSVYCSSPMAADSSTGVSWS